MPFLPKLAIRALDAKDNYIFLSPSIIIPFNDNANNNTMHGGVVLLSFLLAIERKI